MSSDKLSYDKILKHTLAQSDELTVRFINGLFEDTIDPGATVEWLDKETVNDKHVGIIADFYPRVSGRMFHIEIESTDRGEMAVRVLKYAIGGAILHNMRSTDDSVSLTLPKPCVVFLMSGKDTPGRIMWNVNFFERRSVSVQVPVVKLAELSVDEIIRRDLLPVGQFFLRKYAPLTKASVPGFLDAYEKLLKGLKDHVDSNTIPWYIGAGMQDTVRLIAENVIAVSEEEVSLELRSEIIDALPWVDYKAVHERIMEEGREEGKAEGVLEVAAVLFSNPDIAHDQLEKSLLAGGVPEQLIRAAREKAQEGSTKQEPLS